MIFFQIKKHPTKYFYRVALAAMLLLIVTIFLLGCYGVLLSYYGYHWQKTSHYEPMPFNETPFISIIVAVRNEEHTLPLLIQSLQAQSYPADAYEVILVNDHSTDGTASLASHLPERFCMILAESTPATASKKKALATGVQKAKGELIVITDADCIVPPNWLLTIANFQQDNDAKFIAAPVKYTYTNRVVEVFQALDFMILQGITAASVSSRFHSMANGANLAYTKEAYTNVNGFEGIDAVASGDDMLLMYKIWQQHPQQVMYLKSKEAIVATAPMKTWKAFFNQRRRWASKTLHYNDKKVIGVAGLVYLTNVWFLVLLIAVIFDGSNIGLLWTSLLIKTTLELPFVMRVARFYGEEKLLWYFPIFQPLHILYTVSVGFISQLGSYEWKGRKTK